MDQSGELAVAHCTAHRDHHHLFRLVLVVVDQGRADVVDGEAVQPRHTDRGVHGLVGAIAAARTAHALVDPHRNKAVVARQLQRLRMYPCMQLVLVVRHGEQQRRAVLAVLVEKIHRDGLLEPHRIDRIVEIDRLDDLLRGCVLWILVELALGERRLECDGGEFEMVVGHQYMRRECLGCIERHGVMLAHRPVGSWREAQRLVVQPGPFAFCGWLHGNALVHRLADQFDWRSGLRERDLQRIERDRLLGVVGHRRFVDLPGDPDRFWRMRPVLVPLPAVPAARRHECHCQSRRHRLARVAPHREHPFWRGPRDVANHWPQQPADSKTEGAQQAYRQQQQKPQQIHDAPHSSSLIDRVIGSPCRVIAPGTARHVAARTVLDRWFPSCILR